MLQKLEPLLDIDQFLRFWAVETVVGHWDGYTGDLNNFFVYQDPTTNKLTFLPWGTDGSFSKTHAFLPSGQRPVATFAYARLPRRLYEYEPTRERYYRALREVLETAWNEGALLAEIDNMAAVLGMNVGSLSSLRSFVNTRRADIERELANPGVPWTLGERQLRQCNPAAITPVRGTFTTTWNGGDMANAETTFELSLDGKPQLFTAVASSAGSALATLIVGGPPTLRLIGTLEDGSRVTASFSLSATPPRGPGEVLMHGYETYGVVSRSGRSAMGGGTLGYIGEGKLIFEQVALTPGAPVVGRLEGFFVQTRFASASPAGDPRGGSAGP
jgi:hypothetical protein